MNNNKSTLSEKLKVYISLFIIYGIIIQPIFFPSVINASTGKNEKTLLKVKPIVECVIDNGGGAFTAWFGYTNPNPTMVNLPIGEKNNFSPSPANRGQVTSFLPERQRFVFNVPHTGGDLNWNLDNRTATASLANASPCSTFYLRIDTPENDVNTTESTINLSGSAYSLVPNSGGITNITINGNQANHNSSSNTWTYNAFPLNIGRNILTVRVTDGLGNEDTKNVRVYREDISPRIENVEVNKAFQGQNLQVHLTGKYTNWSAGQTTVSFGGEISVGGANEGKLGSVTVIDATHATANIIVNPKAALGYRRIKIVTNLPSGQTEEINLPEGEGEIDEEDVEEVIARKMFSVLPVNPPGSSESNITTIAGSAGQRGFADGTGNQARFKALSGIAVGNDDAIYIADSKNHRIRVARQQADNSWLVQTIAGSENEGFQDGIGSQALFNNPSGVAVSSNGIIYVSDTNNHSIRKILPDGTVSTFAGNGTQGFQDGAGNQARFNNPEGLSIDSAGNIYVADTGNSSVRKIDPNENVTTLAGDGTTGSNDSPNARFNGLSGVVVDGTDVYIYIADSKNHLIRKLNTSGNVTSIAGTSRGFADGDAQEARFARPNGIAIDSLGRFIIADKKNALIRSITPDTNGNALSIGTIAGSGEIGSDDGTGNVAKFNNPKSVAVSRSSAIFVADASNHTIRRIGLPPRINSFAPTFGQVGDTVIINGENFDARGTDKTTVAFTKSGGGTINATVTNITNTQLTVVVPNESATGKITVSTQDGTAISTNDFEIDDALVPEITNFNPKRGQVGTSVKITGTNLKSGDVVPLVTFAGENNSRLNALVTASSLTEVDVLVPNGVITGRIELTNSFGSAQTSQDFVVDETQEFQITVSPSTIEAVERTQGTAVVNLTSNDTTFTQLTNLTTLNLPNGVTAEFEPAQIPVNGSSTLKLDLRNSSLSSGSHSFTVRGTAVIDGQQVSKDVSVSLSIISAGQTTLSGRVLNTEKEPVIGATVSLDGISVTTDSSGSFLLLGVTAGQARPLQIDGRTANSPNRTYPVITEPADIVAGQANQVPYIFYLPPIDIQYEVTIIPGQTAVVGNPKVPDLQMTIPSDANLRNRDGTPVTRVSITPLAIDRTPTPLPSNVGTGLVYTSQPGGALTDVPIPVIYPNILETPPGTQVELYAFNHDTVQWYVYGYGRVSLDGKLIEPEINPNTGRRYGLEDFSWHFPADPNPSGNPGGGPGGGPGGDCSNGSRGNNTVDFSTGTKIESSTDIAFTGSRGGLALGRNYTSEIGRRGIAGKFGVGTNSSYDYRLLLTFGSDGQGGETGFAFLITPEDVQGRMFNYIGRDVSNRAYFTSGRVMQFLGDTIVRDSSGSVRYRRSDGSTMHFTSDGQTTNGYLLTSISDRNGNITTLTYSGNQLTRITDAVNRSIDLTYGTNGFITIARDPKGRVWRYEYDASNRLNRVIDPLNRSIRYEYDANNLLVEIFDPNNIRVKRITYNDQRRVIKQEFTDGGFETYSYQLSGNVVTGATLTSPQGRTISKRFNANGYVLESIDPLGQITKFELDSRNMPIKTEIGAGCIENTKVFDDRGNPTSVTDKKGNTINIQYEPNFNNVTSVTDKLGRTSTMTYDLNGNLKTFTDNINNTVQSFYSSFGQLTEVRDPRGKSSGFEYDASGNISATIDKSGARSTYVHDVLGNLTSSTDPLGRTSNFTYDNANRLITSTDPNGATTTFTYDVNGNLTKITDQLGREWRTVYDSSNRPIESIDPLNRKTTKTYSVDGDLLSVVSPTGRTAKYQYDARGQVTRVTDPENKIVEFTYDYRGNMVSLKDKRGYSTTFVYDELDQLVSARNPLGETSSLQYNAAGIITQATDALGRITTFTHDNNDRRTQINYPDAQVNFTYDELNRVTQINDSQSGTIDWTYDDRGLILGETTSNGTVSYTYNAAGERESMTVPNALPVNYAYDSAGRLQNITQGSEVFTYSYDIISRMTGLTRPNGVSTVYVYDAVDRLQRMSHINSLGQYIEDYQFGYNLNNEISAITTFNSANLLPTAKTADGYNGANRSTQFGDANYTFDSVGQNTSKTDTSGTSQYNWDTRGRLTEAVLPNGNTVSYQYDALGRRKSRTSNGETTEFLYDGLDVVQDQLPNSENVDYLNGFGIDDKLRLQDSSTGANLYFLQDQLGSTQGLTDATGTAVEWQRYTPYGESNLSNPISRYGYTGREFDAETGLIFYRARWYNPTQGRFISEDPKGREAGNNLYEYTGGNPISRTDPLGLDYLDYLPISEETKEKVRNIEMAILAPAAQIAAGVGDTFSMGATRYVRQWMGTDHVIDYCSGLYSAGENIAIVIEIAQGGRGLFKAGGKYATKRALKTGANQSDDIARNAMRRNAGNCVLCFEAETPVETEDGLKPIEEIKEGDKVLSYNEQTGQNEYQTVTQTFTRLADDVLELRVEGETKPIGVTSEHPFYVKRARSDTSDEDDGEWREAIQLQAGDFIRISNGEWAKVLSIRPKGEARVYNFTVAENHNYFVGYLRLLTHNCSREQRWMELANEPNSKLPKEVIDHINRHNGKNVYDRFGLELAHQPKRANAQGFDYSEAIPKTAADHRGIQHRYLKERSTGTTISIPRSGTRGRGRLSLPPQGSLP